MRDRLNGFQSLLNAFVGLFTQPFNQDLQASLKATTTAVFVAMFPAFPLFFKGESQLQVFVISSGVLAFCWILFTAICTRQGRKLMVARNLSIISFWIAATLVFVLIAATVFPNPLDGTLRLIFTIVLLFIFVPIHMFRNLPRGGALKMSIFLLISTIFVAWRVL